MKILFLAPLSRKITAQSKAGRPRLVFDLAYGLAKKGHRITMLATKDSKIADVKIMPVTGQGFYQVSSQFENPFYAHIALLVKQAKMAEQLSSQFDIIHNHSYPELINILASKNFQAPLITTFHQAVTKHLDETLCLFSKQNFISPSKAASKLARKTKDIKTIYHGVDTKLYSFCRQKEDYLLWLGRLSKAKDKKGNFIDPKGVKIAIKLAQETNSKLILSGNVEDVDFYNQAVKPYLSKKIQWLGKISPEPPLTRKQVIKLMQKAKAFLATMQQPEAFGLVIAEAQSCGTPVIGFKGDTAPEIVKHNQTGFVVKLNNLVELKKAVGKLDNIDPVDCRKRAENNFSLEKMVSNYEKEYKLIINNK